MSYFGGVLPVFYLTNVLRAGKGRGVLSRARLVCFLSTQKLMYQRIGRAIFQILLLILLQENKQFDSICENKYNFQLPGERLYLI